MNGQPKSLLRKTLNRLHLDLTKNLKYDRLSKKIISLCVRPDSSCVDVGAHRGEILDLFLQFAPLGHHLAFEPIPSLYNALVKKYPGSCRIYSFALGDRIGKTSFQLVRNAPAYSGILRRNYSIRHPEVEEIEVEMATLDSVVKEEENIDFMKIDVEGAELQVLLGARRTLCRCKPNIIFECGLGASEYYGTSPEDVYDFLTDAVGLKISTLKGWLSDRSQSLTRDEFSQHFKHNTEYYFFAHP